MKRILLFAGIGVIVMLALGIATAQLQAPLDQPPVHGTAFLLKFDGSTDQTNALESMRTAIKKRFSGIDVPFYLERISQDRFRILIPVQKSNTVEMVRGIVTRVGKLKFCLVHPDSNALIKENMLPSGYTVLEIKVQKPVHAEVPPYVEKFVVKNNAEAGLAGDIVDVAYLEHSAIGLPQIAFRLKPEASAAFAKVTSDNIGRQLAIIIDDKLCTAPVIQSPLTTGSGVISGNFDDNEAGQLCCVLNSPLPMPVTLLEVKSF